MFGIGETELALILLFAFLVFGPDKLPGMGRTIGRALRQFRTAQEGFTKVVQTEVIDPATEAMSDTPKKPNRSRDEELDADLDDKGDATATPKHKETFAERKARLEAERKAAAEPVVVEAADGDAKGAADSDADATEEAPKHTGHPAATRRPAEKPKAPTSAAELYALKPKPKAEPVAAEVEQAVEPATSEPAPAVDSAAEPEPATAPEENGKEDGSEEA